MGACRRMASKWAAGWVEPGDGGHELLEREGDGRILRGRPGGRHIEPDRNELRERERERERLRRRPGGIQQRAGAEDLRAWERKRRGVQRRAERAQVRLHHEELLGHADERAGYERGRRGQDDGGAADAYGLHGDLRGLEHESYGAAERPVGLRHGGPVPGAAGGLQRRRAWRLGEEFGDQRAGGEQRAGVRRRARRRRGRWRRTRRPARTSARR